MNTFTTGDWGTRLPVVSLLLLVASAATAAARPCGPEDSPARLAVREAQLFLADAQHSDGSWDAQREGVEAPPPLRRVGVSALSVLALMESGNTPEAGPFKQVVRTGLEWLIEQQDAESGLIGAEVGYAFLYDHGIATLALCEAHRHCPDAGYEAAAEGAVRLVLRARNPYSAWRYDLPPIGDNDTSITGWMVLALKSAERAGLRVDSEAFVGALHWFDSATDETTGRVGYSGPGSRSSRIPGVNDHFPPELGEAMTAVALYCRQEIGQSEKTKPILARHAELLLRRLPAWDPQGLGTDMYYWYFGTRAMHALGGERWKAWRAALAETLPPHQAQDGSWPAVGPWGTIGGSSYATALMLSCLALDPGEESLPEVVAADPEPPEPPIVEPPAEAVHGSRAAVRSALAWLAANQAPEGHWNLEAFPSLADPEDGGHAVNEVGVTGLALLAFLGDGNTFEEGRYRQNVLRGVKWLCEQQDEETGLLGEAHGHAFLYSHGIATAALCEAYLTVRAPILERPAQQAVTYVLRARNPYAAWRYDVPPIGDNDTSVTTWMVLALERARRGGLSTDPAAFEGALNWVREVTDPESGRVGYDSVGSPSSRIAGINEHFPPGSGEAMTGAGLYLRLLMGDRPSEHPEMKRGAQLLLKKLPHWAPKTFESDQYYWLHGSNAMQLWGGRNWEVWRRALREALIPKQRRDGELAGSWDPIGPWRHAGGRVYATATMALALQTDYREPGLDIEAGGSGDGKRGGRFGRMRGIEGGQGTEQALKDGLEWLKLHQDADGMWDCDEFMKHDPPDDQCEGPGDPLHDVGVTGLALLAFLGDGNTLRRGPDKDVVTRGVKWLREQQDYETGLIGEEIGHTFLYDHAIASLAICEAYYFSKSPLIERTAQQSVNYILRARNPYAAWRYDVPPIGDNDTSVTSWMVFALTSAQDAELKVPRDAFQGAMSWLNDVTDPATGRVGYDTMGSFSSRITGINEHYPPEKGEAMTAAGLLCRFFLGEDPDEQPLMEKHAELMLKTLPEWDPKGYGCDMYYWYYGSYAMSQMGKHYWKTWNKAMKEAVLESQRHDGAHDGSWDPVGPWGHSGGRVYSTAMMVLCLEVYSRYTRVRGSF